MMFGLYIHLPFCVRKCFYCDFNSRPVQSGEVEAYVSALVRELSVFARDNRRKVDTLYFGGGTPTLLSNEQFTRLLDILNALFDFSPSAEITVEANPGTLDEEKAECLLALGVNRISLGVQSLHDELLKRMGRIHSTRQALEAFDMIKRTGFSNIGVDLIYGLPDQSMRMWEEDLSGILELGPDHLSLYGLSVEGETPFGREKRNGSLPLPSESEVIRMYETAKVMTAASGFEHYEISNFASPGFRCRHNLLYWTLNEYYGAGAGAHSFLKDGGPVRFCNLPDPDEYIGRLQRGESPIVDRELLSRRVLAGEALMLGLRMREGVDRMLFSEIYGLDPLKEFSESLDSARKRGWVDSEEGRIRLTDSGILFSNEVFMGFF